MPVQDWLADSGRLHRISELLQSTSALPSLESYSVSNSRPSSGSFAAVADSAVHGGVPVPRT
jgi:hypothetical protein